MRSLGKIRRAFFAASAVIALATAATAAAALAAEDPLTRYPQRVYVPNNKADTVQVIDPFTYEVVATYPTGRVPHHVTPSWDLSVLYVNNTAGNSLTVLDPATGAVVREIRVRDPYNLYFTPDGRYAVVVAERLKSLDFRDRVTWKLVKSVKIYQPGPNHLAFSRDGSYLLVSTEFSGWLVKVDVGRLQALAEMYVGGEPVDVVRPPGQHLMFVANQSLAGVHVVDPDALTEIIFIPTGKGAHGILSSHDRRRLYVSNRDGGTISVIDVASQRVVETWRTGGSPDMGQLSPDGSQLWISNRYHEQVQVIDTATGKVVRRIKTGAGPHGLIYFPNSHATRSLGHNGIYVED